MFAVGGLSLIMTTGNDNGERGSKTLYYVSGLQHTVQRLVNLRAMRLGFVEVVEVKAPRENSACFGCVPWFPEVVSQGSEFDRPPRYQNSRLVTTLNFSKPTVQQSRSPVECPIINKGGIGSVPSMGQVSYNLSSSISRCVSKQAMIKSLLIQICPSDLPYPPVLDLHLEFKVLNE